MSAFSYTAAPAGWAQTSGFAKGPRFSAANKDQLNSPGIGAYADPPSTITVKHTSPTRPSAWDRRTRDTSPVIGAKAAMRMGGADKLPEAEALGPGVYDLPNESSLDLGVKGEPHAMYRSTRPRFLEDKEDPRIRNVRHASPATAARAAAGRAKAQRVQTPVTQRRSRSGRGRGGRAQTAPISDLRRFQEAPRTASRPTTREGAGSGPPLAVHGDPAVRAAAEAALAAPRPTSIGISDDAGSGAAAGASDRAAPAGYYHPRERRRASLFSDHGQLGPDTGTGGGTNIPLVVTQGSPGWADPSMGGSTVFGRGSLSMPSSPLHRSRSGAPGTTASVAIVPIVPTAFAESLSQASVKLQKKLKAPPKRRPKEPDDSSSDEDEAPRRGLAQQPTAAEMRAQWEYKADQADVEGLDEFSYRLQGQHHKVQKLAARREMTAKQRADAEKRTLKAAAAKRKAWMNQRKVRPVQAHRPLNLGGQEEFAKTAPFIL